VHPRSALGRGSHGAIRQAVPDSLATLGTERETLVLEHRIGCETRGRRPGIPVSVGVGPTKTLAKIANRTAKKNPSSGGVCILLSPAGQIAALERLELTDIWGVGARLGERLADFGITRAVELRNADHRFIRERVSVVLERTVLELKAKRAFTSSTPRRRARACWPAVLSAAP
jgi:nucleotidyltransferase/DNA polymerase involved in DNA repair